MPYRESTGHEYHAEAIALSGTLTIPLEQKIDPQATALLQPNGGYLAQKTGEFRLESVLSFKSAHTQVSGMPSGKADHGHATLSTAVVEGLNILEILTCDRIVAQVATVHPLRPQDGTPQKHTPEIVFLGTRFENLRIAGEEVLIKLDVGQHELKSPEGLHYFDEPLFLAKIAAYCQKLRDHTELPDAARARYTGKPEPPDEAKRALNYSLVSEIRAKTPETFPGTIFGHVISVPHFGTIDLATVSIAYEYDKNDVDATPKTTVELKMVEVKLGCIGDGSVDVATAKTNGGNGG